MQQINMPPNPAARANAKLCAYIFEFKKLENTTLHYETDKLAKYQLQKYFGGRTPKRRHLKVFQLNISGFPVFPKNVIVQLKWGWKMLKISFWIWHLQKSVCARAWDGGHRPRPSTSVTNRFLVNKFLSNFHRRTRRGGAGPPPVEPGGCWDRRCYSPPPHFCRPEKNMPKNSGF